MKSYTAFILPFAFITAAFIRHQPPRFSMNQQVVMDTMPDICTVLPGRDIEALQPFTHPLSNNFPDPNAFETYTGCYYQFYTANNKPQLAVRLIKWGSKEEAGAEFAQQVQSHFDHWGIAPERLNIEADSVYFGYNTEHQDLCDECGLVVAQGVYTIYISFKGEYETVTRARKKTVALHILRMMYDRIPGLAPSRILNKQ